MTTSHADLGVCKQRCLQDFIVNLAGMEFGAGGHPGLQVWRVIKVLAIMLLE